MRSKAEVGGRGTTGSAENTTVGPWRVSVSTVFWLSGFAVASWLARVPGVRDDLQASALGMGVLALGIAAGSVAGFAVARRMGTRFAPRRVIGVALVVVMAGLLLAGAASTWCGSYSLCFAGLVLVGLGNGTCNVTMNVEGAAIERRLGRPIMPWFHALFSIGAAVGASIGAVAAANGVPPAVDMIVVAAVCALLWPRAVRDIGSVPEPPTPKKAAPDDATARRSPWLESRTLLIGLVVVGMSFANGAGNDWIALGFADGHGTDDAVAALGVDLFTVAVVGARLVGVPMVARFGRVLVVRCSAVVAATGLAVFILVPGTAPAFAGVALWGLGVALAFPIAMSAAADDPRGAAGRIAVVAAIGYSGSLVGPPLIGFVAGGTGVLHALIIVVVLLGAAGVVAPALRPDSHLDAIRVAGSSPT